MVTKVAQLVRGTLLLAAAVALSTGCRGQRSTEPPIHLNPNMDFQQKYEAQEESDFSGYTDSRAARLPVHKMVNGSPEFLTVARIRTFQEDDDYLRADTHRYQGRDANGRLVDALPEGIVLDQALLDRGEERYGIFCVPCHAKTGNGDGIVMRRGFPKNIWPKSYHSPEMRAMPLGYFFHVITHGKGAMGSYAAQVPVSDRWAIASWLRTLQRSRAASLADIPADVRQQNKWSATP